MAAGDGDRAELLGYGLMVDAAYLTYDAVKKQTDGRECYEAVLSDELDKLIVTAGVEHASRRRRRHVVTAHFFATIEPHQAVVNALVGGVDKTYWFGYVAVARRGDCWDVVVAWRGSATLADWMMDMHVMNLVDFGGGGAAAGGHVAEGFYNVYTSKDAKVKHGTVSAKEQAVMEVKRLVFRVIVKQDIVPKLPMGEEYVDAGDGDYDIIKLDDGGNWLSPLELIRAHSLDLYLQLITLRNPAIASVLSNSNSDAPPQAKEEWKDMKEEEGYMRLPFLKLKEELDKLEGPSPKK
uniref:Uncharacterized protein n=1 Tax=Oryza barthii TaxID=65489 RepID=A0A0D3HWQ1_9ORYZ